LYENNGNNYNRMRGLTYYLLLPILRIKRLSDSTHLFMYIRHYIWCFAKP